MIDIEELTSELIADEGVRLLVYDDATGLPLRPGSVIKGHPTIGIGRALDTHGISYAEALFLLNNDETDVVEQLTNNLPWFGKLDDVRQTTLANITINLGLGGLLGFHEMLTLIAESRYDQAADSMLASKWAKELGSRATRLAEQMRTGQWQPSRAGKL